MQMCLITKGRGSTPLQFEQLGLEITAIMRLVQKKSCCRCFLICCGLESISSLPENGRKQCLHGYEREKGCF